jgi:hypothetical protein
MDIGFPSKVESRMNRASALEAPITTSIPHHRIKSTHFLKTRMSLESNISGKAREKFNNKDLFEHLTYEDPYLYEMRAQGSFEPKSRNTEGEKIEYF